MSNPVEALRQEIERAKQALWSAVGAEVGDPSYDDVSVGYLAEKAVSALASLRGAAEQPQDGAFHWRDGWYFSRTPDDAVEVRTPHGAVTIPREEWQSILLAVAGPTDPVDAADHTRALLQATVKGFEAGRGAAEPADATRAEADDLLAVAQVIVNGIYWATPNVRALARAYIRLRADPLAANAD